MIYGIVAVDNHWGIGKNGQLLFKLKKDMAFFKAKTTEYHNTVVVMGLNTFNSLPKRQPLKDRINIVLCPEGTELPEGVLAYHNFGLLVDSLQKMRDTHEIFIIGGGMMYQSMLPYYDFVYVTKVAADGGADTFFPNIEFDAKFRLVLAGPWQTDGDYKISFTKYESIEHYNCVSRTDYETFADKIK